MEHTKHATPLKQLPPGIWLTLRSLPKDTTSEEILDWLKVCGIDLPQENVVINDNHWKYSLAIISLDRPAVADLFRRATFMHEFKGQEMEFTFKREEDSQAARR